MASRGARWDPFREIAQLQNELSRVVGNLREEGQGLMPPADVWETDTELVFAFDLPGVSEDAISIELEDNTLTVTAERQPPVEPERLHRRERRFGTYSRTIAVPPGTAEDAVAASSENGVLEIRVRKPEEAKPRKIQIGVKSGDSG